MKAIAKGSEPTSLTAHRLTAYSDYENYLQKDDLRRALVRDQRGLCCYCMGRIRSEGSSMKIEHWRCQSRHPEGQLIYANLLGACTGGDGRPDSLQHCDSSKGDRDLRWNPAEPAHRIEMRVKYDPDGRIRSDDPVFDSQLNRVLNLNLPQMRNNRKGVLTAVLAWWKARKPVPRERIERAIQGRTDGTGDLQPYCQVAAWWLSQKLARMA